MSGTQRTPEGNTNGETEGGQQTATGDDLNVFDLDFNYKSFNLAETRDSDPNYASEQTPSTSTNESDSAFESASASSFERESNNGEGKGHHWSAASTSTNESDSASESTSASSFERESNKGEGHHWSDASTTASPIEEQTPTTMEPSIMAPTLGSAFRIIWDSGASICATNCKEDFDRLQAMHARVGSIVDSAEVEGCGHISWTFKTSNTSTSMLYRTIILPALYIPTLPDRILSTSSLLKKYPKECITMSSTGMRLSGNQDLTEPTSPIEIFRDPQSQLPVTLAYHGRGKNKVQHATSFEREQL